ncbi:Caspase domain containing protein [Lactarius tabidus]
MGSFISSISRCFSSYFRRFTNSNVHVRLPDPDLEEGKPTGTIIGRTLGPIVKLKRRALLVGITYAHSPQDTWWELENPHKDVNMFRDLLVGTYGYSLEDITILKDGPNFPDDLQPTRENMIRELTRLVADAASGDKFTFFYSGHSDQQTALDDSEPEDGQDEVIITSDIQRIVDNELHDILVRHLPAGTFLLGVFDTCHSGTMLDLPHYHCNSIYVPWQSKGQRVTMTMRNNNVRHHAMGLSGLQGAAFPLPSIVSVMARGNDSNTRLYSDPLPAPCPRLRIDTKLGESTEDEQPNKRWKSMGSEACPARKGRPRSIGSILPLMRVESPVSNVCDGWCGHNPFAHRTALSLSACSDPQRAWEGPRGSLATVLCKYLKAHPRPSYHNLMSHVNFELHANSRDLHAYSLKQKKEGVDFDGELDNFQEPKLSSLWRLNMDEIFEL